MDSRGLTNRYCLGDLVGYGTFPNEVIARIRERSIPTLMGNYDQGVGNDSDDCGCAYKDALSEALGKRSIAWSNAHTAADNKAYLRGLPAHIPLHRRAEPHGAASAAAAASQEKLSGARCQAAIKPWMVARTIVA